MPQFLHPISLINRTILTGVVAAIVLSSTLGGAVARTRVGLVLGGGGARGAAHIGVLEVLHEQRIPIDCLSGTSMGALVSGAFAAGLSPDEMISAMERANWQDMFNDNPPTYNTNPRKKSLSRRFIAGSEMGFTEKGPEALPGVVDGQKIKLFINKLVHSEYGDPQIEQMQLPLSIVSTDLVTGGKVVFREGSLTKAMRASMSIPAAMTPVKEGEKLLVDGALVANIPIEEVRDQCNPDIVIAVNVGSPLLKAEQIGGIPSTVAQMVNILTEQNVTRSLADLRPDDILIKPDLEGISAGDFEKFNETIKRGREATKAALPRLRELSVDRAQYENWLVQIKQIHPKSPPVVDEIEITGINRVNPKYVERHLREYEGVPINTEHLENDLGLIYGDGEYQSVDYSLLTTRDKNILRITPIEKKHGPDYLRLGLNFESTSETSTFNFRAAYQKTWLNRLGGEWLAGLQVGNEPGVFTEFYQPLDPKQQFFLEPKLSFTRGSLNIYENNINLAEYETDRYTLDLIGGVNIDLLGPIKIGWSERYRSADLEIGSPLFENEKKHFGGWLVTIDFDQFDRLYVPTHGWSFKGSYFDTPEENYSKARLELRGAQNLGEYVFSGRLQFEGSPEGTLPNYDAVTLGGFLNLSGFMPNQIVGDSLYYASASSLSAFKLALQSKT